ncbi:J domain-containing protein [Lacibacterium aquatile]|uniref:J domain-containing protein n=1 Tax=Lacibacterium aquatile TaxID=1168082 RepID=A0ABW5DTJ4_9PROT
MAPSDPREVRAALDAALEAQAMLDGVEPVKKSSGNLQSENERLRAALSRMAFRPLVGGVRSVGHATYVLGVPGAWGLDEAVIQARYRFLASIFHPDSGLIPDSERLRQLNDARSILLRHLAEE